MSNYVGTWGIYSAQYKDIPNLIHPDDFQIVSAEGFFYKMFHCSGETGNGYLILEAGNTKYRAKPARYYMYATPLFNYDDLVRDKVLDRVGSIRLIDWHYKHKREYYYLTIDNRKSTRRYWAEELELISAPNEDKIE